MCVFFFFNDTATTEIYPLPLHDARPISSSSPSSTATTATTRPAAPPASASPWAERSGCRSSASSSSTSSCRSCSGARSEEHTSELQSRQYLVCRLLLEKKKIHISGLLTV